MAGYIGSRAAVATSGVERKKTFAITTTTTSLTGLDYTPNHVHVFHNGIRLVDGTDYTATNGTSITLVNAAENGDEVVVVSYGTFSPADTYTKTEADALIAGVGTNLTLTGTPVEDVYAISGTSVALEPDNGSVQTHTLTGNTTYTDSFSAGQAITLMIDDGTAYTVTWPTMTWVNNAAAAPTLATTGYTVVALWKVGSTLYGALVGDGS